MTTNFFQLSFSDDRDLRYSPNKDNILDTFSDIKYKIFSLSDASRLLYRSDYPGLYNAFCNVKPYAFKADIVRYYLMYKFGGWYSDVNNYFLFEPDISQTDILLFRDIPEWCTEDSVTCGLFYARPGNDIFKEAVDQCIENVENQYYGDQTLEVTGPTMFGKVVNKKIEDLAQLNRFYFYNENNARAFFLNQEKFALYKPYGDFYAQSGLPGGNSYLEMWNAKEVY